MPGPSGYTIPEEGITVSKFIAGWNIPGCLPDTEPVVFDTEEEARAFVENEQQEAAEIYAEAGMTDPYVYWVEPNPAANTELCSGYPASE